MGKGSLQNMKIIQMSEFKMGIFMIRMHIYTSHSETPSVNLGESSSMGKGRNCGAM